MGVNSDCRVVVLLPGYSNGADGDGATGGGSVAPPLRSRSIPEEHSNDRSAETLSPSEAYPEECSTQAPTSGCSSATLGLPTAADSNAALAAAEGQAEEGSSGFRKGRWRGKGLRE